MNNISSGNSSGGGSDWINAELCEALDQRRVKGTLRHLPASLELEQPTPLQQQQQQQQKSILDFSSNDYLGLAQSAKQRHRVEQKVQELTTNTGGGSTSVVVLGATGSRLLSGDSRYFHQLEQYLASAHNREAALLCNSGYDANLSVVSSLPCDCILYDDLVHNSLHMGMRLWASSSPSSTTSPSALSDATATSINNNNNNEKRQQEMVSFKHNDVDDLRLQLEQLQQKESNKQQSRKQKKKMIAVLVESVYSMDGDVAPIRAILDVCAEYNAVLIVDEAHGLGVFGRTTSSSLPSLPPGTGVLAQLECEQHPALFCSIHTFGKAAGCHGAVICGSRLMKDYLVNYAYPFIYSTALPFHSLATIHCSYESMTSPTIGNQLRNQVFQMMDVFQTKLSKQLELRQKNNQVYLLPSDSPIQALMIPGNERCTDFCRILYKDISKGRVRLYPIKSPTVPAGLERVRIILHSHNSLQQVEELMHYILQTLERMELIAAPPGPIMVSRL